MSCYVICSCVDTFADEKTKARPLTNDPNFHNKMASKRKEIAICIRFTPHTHANTYSNPELTLLTIPTRKQQNSKKRKKNTLAPTFKYAKTTNLILCGSFRMSSFLFMIVHVHLFTVILFFTLKVLVSISANIRVLICPALRWTTRLLSVHHLRHVYHSRRPKAFFFETHLYALLSGEN